METIDTPYRISDVYQLQYEDGEYSLERSPVLFGDIGSVSHVVLEGETLQSIAFTYYGDSGKWGDIATYNGIINPLEPIYGKIIQIPNING